MSTSESHDLLEFDFEPALDSVASLAERLPEPVIDLIEPILPARKRGLLGKLGLDGLVLGGVQVARKSFGLPSRTFAGELASAARELREEFEGLAQIVVDRLPAPLAELTPLRTPKGADAPTGSWNLAAITSALLSVGPLHFIAPRSFDDIIPPSLPGSPRLWTYLSGVAEIAVGGLLVVPRTRRLGGLAAASLFAAVFPANVQMAKNLQGKGVIPETFAYGRLPLQFPLIYGALRIAVTGK